MKKIVAVLLTVLSFTLFCVGATYRDTPNTDVPDYKQDDPRWADMVYSSHGDASQTVKYHGCALCVVADMLAYWFDEEITPPDIIPLAQKVGAVAYRSGTYRMLYSRLGEFYPLAVISTDNIDDVLTCLQNGGLAIASFRTGVWNQDPSRRHSCLIYAYGDGEFWLHDPGWSDPLMSKIIGHGSYDEIKQHAEMFWCYKPTEPEEQGEGK